MVNEGKDFEGATVYLTDDLNMGYYAWTPIGNSSDNPFKGTFNGNGYTITKLLSELSGDMAGLFGCNEGTITDVTVEGYTALELETANEIPVGGLVAKNYGEVSNCIGNIDIVVIQTGNVRMYVGGVVGSNDGVVSSSTNNGDIYAEGSGATFAAGIVGKSNHKDGTVLSITDCTNNGNIYASALNATGHAGGIVGNVDGEGSITSCVNNGAITGITLNANSSSTFNATAGGIAGDVSNNTITGCTNTGAIVAKGTYDHNGSHAGGIIGYMMTSGTLHQCTNSAAAVVTSNKNAGGIVGTLSGTAILYECCQSLGTPTALYGETADTANTAVCTEGH